MSSATPNLGLVKPVAGESDWLNTFNNNAQVIDTKVNEAMSAVPVSSLAYGTSVLGEWISDPSIVTDQANPLTAKSLAKIIADLSGASVDLRLPSGTYYIWRNYTIPATIKLKPDNGVLFTPWKSIRETTYKWTASSHGTSEYYLELAAGGNPLVYEPTSVYANSLIFAAGTAGALTASQWDWADNDGLGYATIYLRLADSADPDGKAAGYVEAWYTLTIGSLVAGYTQIFDTKGIIAFSAGHTATSRWWGAVGNGTTDDITPFTRAVASLPLGGTVKESYAPSGYEWSNQLTLANRIVLDMSGSTIIESGYLLDASLPSAIVVTGVGNRIKDVVGNTLSGQYVIEFGSSSKNNIEEGCRQLNSSGISNLVKNENSNVYARTNRSLSIEAYSTAGPVRGRVRIWNGAITINTGTSGTITASLFPSEAIIRRIIVTDAGGSPDFAASLYANTACSVLVWTRARGVDVNETVNLNYFKVEMNDVLKFYIWNYKGTSATFNVEIHYENPHFYIKKPVWMYSSKDDFRRPHCDNIGAYTAVSETTIKAVEHRFYTNEDAGTTFKQTVTPSRSVTTFYPTLTIPSPAGKTQDKTYSQLKFYFHYPASRAVVEQPTHFSFAMKDIPKNMDCSLICGWLSQNKDGIAAYLKQSMIFPNEAPYAYTLAAPCASESVLSIKLDPKAYQLASGFEGSDSFDYFYFIFETDDASYAFEFGESYSFNGYFWKDALAVV
jgi:hypothetical protein